MCWNFVDWVIFLAVLSHGECFIFKWCPFLCDIQMVCVLRLFYFENWPDARSVLCSVYFKWSEVERQFCSMGVVWMATISSGSHYTAVTGRIKPWVSTLPFPNAYSTMETVFGPVFGPVCWTLVWVGLSQLPNVQTYSNTACNNPPFTFLSTLSELVRHGFWVFKIESFAAIQQ